MAIEIISTLKQKNNGTFPLIDSNDIQGGYYQVDTLKEMNDIPLERKKEGMLCYVKNDKIYKLNSDLITWEEFKTSGNQIEYNNTKPIDEDVKIWVDTSDMQECTSSISDKIIDEFRAMFNFMQNQIDTLKQANIKLEARISYLEQNGSGGGVDPDEPTSTDVILTFEDGSTMTFEDGNTMTFETIKEVVTNDTIMTFENGETLTFENGEVMIFEDSKVVTSDIIMTFEGNETMIFEDGNIMIFEK